MTRLLLALALLSLSCTLSGQQVYAVQPTATTAPTLPATPAPVTVTIHPVTVTPWTTIAPTATITATATLRSIAIVDDGGAVLAEPPHKIETVNIKRREEK